jgi:hypothetical protein
MGLPRALLHSKTLPSGPKSMSTKLLHESTTPRAPRAGFIFALFLVIILELFRNKRQGKLSFKKAMEGAKRWVYSSETTVR